MMCEVTFKDGSTSTMELIYNWDRCHIYRTTQSYIIVPYGDVIHSKVTMEEFVKAAKEAKEAPKIKKAIEWKEIKPTSNSGID